MFRNASRSLLSTLRPILNSTLLKYHTTRILKNKLFQETENQYAHSILFNRPISKPLQDNHPKTTLHTLDDLDKFLDRNWRSADIGSIVEAFETITDLCREKNLDLTKSRFDGLVDGLLDNVEYLSDDALLRLMESLEKMPPTPKYDSRNYHAVWSALDDVCYSKMKLWDVDTMLMFAERWYRLHLGKLQFTEILLNINYLFSHSKENRLRLRVTRQTE